MSVAPASVIKAPESAPATWNRIRKTSAVLRKLSPNAEKNWHQKRGAKRRDVIKDMAHPFVAQSRLFRPHSRRPRPRWRRGMKSRTGYRTAPPADGTDYNGESTISETGRKKRPWRSQGLSTAVRCRVLRPAVLPLLLHGLPVEGEIEPFTLDVLADAQPDDQIDDLEDDQRHDHVVDEHAADADDLVEHLAGIALDQSGGTAVGADSEHAGEDRAGGSANRVHAEGIERVIVAEHVLEAGAAPVADDAGGEADEERSHRADKAGGRRDGDEAGDGARADADDRRLAAHDPLDDHPGETGRRRGGVADRHCHAGLHPGAHRRAGIESEPADPEERCADHRQHHV